MSTHRLSGAGIAFAILAALELTACGSNSTANEDAGQDAGPDAGDAGSGQQPDSGSPWFDAGPPVTNCQMHTADGTPVQHVIHIIFDNVHWRRDNPNVPSDLEQIPSLKNFLEQNGTVLLNH